MRLQRVQVQNYRSLVDSGIVNIEDVVTVLIGKNEQGKTNFLKALASFSERHQYGPGELPNHLRPQLEDQDPAEIPVVTLWMTPETAEKSELTELVPEIDTVEAFKAIRYLDNHYEYFVSRSDGAEAPLAFSPVDISELVEELKGEAEALRKKLEAHGSRVAEFGKALDQANEHVDQFAGAQFDDASQVANLIKTFTTALKGLPGQDAPVQEDIAAAVSVLQKKQASIQNALQTDPSAAFKEHMPSFVFHSAGLDRIPNEVNVAQFVADPDGVSIGMANLCSVAGLSTQKIQELAGATDTAQRETYEDHYKASISGGINEFWTQAVYAIHFRIEREKLSVSISDDQYSPRIPPTERSDGFQWYLSFYAALLNEASATSHTVMLLDNPGLELHADGQRDIKRFLEEKLPRSTQVIYVTHSPAMIDPFNLEQVRNVELRGDEQGTKVANWMFKEGGDADLLEPIRSAIGASLVTSLMFNDYNILVEGAADRPILEGAFGVLHENEAKRILVNGSVSESEKGFLPRFYERANLPFIVFLDADSRGRQLTESLKKWDIPAEKIAQLDTMFPDRKGSDFELEDVLDAEFYHRAVSETYPDKPVDQPTTDAGKCTKLYEEAYRAKYDIGFSKRRVADTVKKLLGCGEADAKTVENLGKVTAAILEGLKIQATAAPAARAASESREGKKVEGEKL